MPEDESQTPMAIPSFASLRSPRRRPAMEWLDSTPPRAPSLPAPQPPRAPRPAEWPDLLRLGVHLTCSVARLTGRLALWPLRRIGGHPLP
jgi:hypothetical protein